jgi:hypothetical protein
VFNGKTSEMPDGRCLKACEGARLSGGPTIRISSKIVKHKLTPCLVTARQEPAEPTAGQLALQEMTGEGAGTFGGEMP